MTPYLELHHEQLVLMLGYGLLGLFALTLVWTAGTLIVGRGAVRGHEDEHLERFPDGIEEGHGKLPFALILLYATLAVWTAVYLAATGIFGMDFLG